MNPKAIIDRLESNPPYLEDNASLSPISARILYLIARIGDYKNILEIGTSIGYSTLYLGWAAADNGGKVDSIDIDAERQSQARRHLDEAGLSQTVAFHLSDALETLHRFSAEGRMFDFIFMDARKKEYLMYFNILEKHIKPNGVFIADNSQSHRHKMLAFLEEVYNKVEWETFELQVGKGILVGIKSKQSNRGI